MMRLWGTPVPIPNTKVKTQSAEDTWWETAWENRSLPVLREDCFTETESSPILAPWSSGQDVALSRQNHGFDSHWRCHQTERFCSVFLLFRFFQAFLLLLFLSNRYTKYCIFVRFFFACLLLPFRWNVQAESLILFVFSL